MKSQNPPKHQACASGPSLSLHIPLPRTLAAEENQPRACTLQKATQGKGAGLPPVPLYQPGVRSSAPRRICRSLLQRAGAPKDRCSPGQVLLKVDAPKGRCS